MNNSSSHIPSYELVDLIENLLPTAIHETLKRHLATCEVCAEELAQLERLIELMRTDTAEDAPPHLIQNVKRLYRSRDKPKTPASDLRRHILAVLRFDSSSFTPVLGVRSSGSSPRQLLLNAEVCDIDLRLEPHGDGWAISGQVLGEVTSRGRVMLFGTQGATFASINAQSEFSLPPAPAGRYNLILSLEDVDIEIKELKIG